jgi:hypothetical protein
VDRARTRLTLTRAVGDRLRVGIEANPEGDDYGLLANWRLLDETTRTPALIVGTSSDRIGTPSGRAYFATVSKDLEHTTGLPVAPYLGAAFGEYDDRWRLIGGLGVRWTEHLSSTNLWDGVHLHHTLTWTSGSGRRLGLVVAEQEQGHYLGLTLCVSF